MFLYYRLSYNEEEGGVEHCRRFRRKQLVELLIKSVLNLFRKREFSDCFYQFQTIFGVIGRMGARGGQRRGSGGRSDRLREFGCLELV